MNFLGRAACSIFISPVLFVVSYCGAAPVRLVDEAPVAITTVAPGVVLVDFGRVAFGNLQITPAGDSRTVVTVHFGEALVGGRINRKPPGSVRYARAQVKLVGGKSVLASPPVDSRNTEQPAAVLTPPEWGVVMPFRWVEIEGLPGEPDAGQLRRRSAFSSTWDDQAASFQCSDALLNRVWELCRYSIKATTFAGVYVDGDRERISYEADAYLNQLSHYATDNDIQMARDTYDRLMVHPTWPSEWSAHMIFMAHADWMHTGDRSWLAPRYEALKAKLLLKRARPDGLLVSDNSDIKQNDIVDWPVAERDGYVFTSINTVVNAFHLRALHCMAELAGALERDADVEDYTARETRTRAAFHEKLFDAARGVYRDGEGTDHASLHASLFPLSFGLVPVEQRAALVGHLAKRGMACSVYAAQYLLEGLFNNEAGSQALALVTAPNNRSWKHMLESGTTITWEAWDQCYKPNQDWNHAWGAAPANLLPRFVLGAQALAPGWTRALIRPNPANLTFAEGKIPTPRGPIFVRWESGSSFRLSLKLPGTLTAKVELPAEGRSGTVFIGGKSVGARRVGQRWILNDEVAGAVVIELK